jgi:hypothetical protein
MRVHLLVRLDVAGNAQQLDVLRIVRPRLHAIWTVNGVSTFNWFDVVTINSGGDESIALAPFTQSASSLPHYPLHLCPTWRVQQLLVSFISAHTRHHSTPSGRKSIA